MAVAEAPANRLVLDRRLGTRLRDARKHAKATQAAAAKALKVTHATISNFERGEYEPTVQQLEVLLGVYGVEAGLREQTIALLRAAQESPRAWWDDYTDLFTTAATFRFWAYEDAADTHLIYSGPLVPGNLQTREFAERLADFYHPSQGRDYRRRFVESRLKRFQVVERAERLEFVCSEVALRSRVGGAEVHQRQVEKLVEVAQRPNVSFRVIPIEAEMSSLSGNTFTVLEYNFPEDPSVLFSNLPRSGLLSTDEREVDAEVGRFRAIQKSALSDDATLALLKEVAQQ
ncbi:DUF5753 domain-containing protein [Streptomyces sp. BI20]|uniref:DUF5753 domain-containing protein n=1 Tax=Streptomyces sp. BI20 TaxID=3403460 RepID=UPI003C75BC34